MWAHEHEKLEAVLSQGTVPKISFVRFCLKLCPVAALHMSSEGDGPERQTEQGTGRSGVLM